MGLRIPQDVDKWRRWQDGQRPVHRLVRTLASKVRPAAPAGTAAFVAVSPGAGNVHLAAILESRATSSRMALLAPLAHLPSVGTAVVSPFDPSEFLPRGWSARAVDDVDFARLFPELRVVLSAAHYLPLGAAAFADATRRGHTYVTAQHGLLTPASPPLPSGAPFLAWSGADAEFWLSGRQDAAAVAVGSQLLWAAARKREGHVSRFDRPVFLGQLHGAELPRASMVKAITEFCRQTGAIYRPHPSETDRLSTIQHGVWQRLGIEIDRTGRPLDRLRAPVVSIFSTGLLEAAAQGTPAWAYCPSPPAWLSEFWDRYGLGQWGGPPTPAPPLPEREPAQTIAQWLEERL